MKLKQCISSSIMPCLQVRERVAIRYYILYLFISTALERYFGIPLEDEAPSHNKDQHKDVTMLELKPTKVGIFSFCTLISNHNVYHLSAFRTQTKNSGYSIYKAKLLGSIAKDETKTINVHVTVKLYGGEGSTNEEYYFQHRIQYST